MGFRHAGVVICEIIDGDFHPIEAEVVTTEKANKKTNIKVAVDDFNNMCFSFRAIIAMAEKHRVDAIFAELPSGGGKSSSAVKAMAISTAITACIIERLKLPYHLVTPIENKVALVGTKTASKDEMQDACHAKYPSPIWMQKHVIKSGKNKGGLKYPDDFEHIADAMGACVASKETSLFRLLASR